jgi:heptosyltransferase-3
MEDGILNSLISKNKFKILIIQLRQLGDVILTTPLVRQIRSIYPQAEIHFLTEKLGSNVYLNNKNIDKMLIVPQKMKFSTLINTYFKIFKENYNLVIDCFGNPKSAQFTFFSRANERIGFNFKSRKYAYTKKINSTENNEYSAISKLRLIEELGGNLSDYQIEFVTSASEIKFAAQFAEHYFKNKKVIALNTVSRRNYKIWDSNKYAELANLLIEKDFFIFLTYGPNEYDMAANVYNKILDKNSALINYKNNTVGEFAAILKHCHAYIGNDGGIKHLAVCADIPTLTIFQNINWANWTPKNSHKHFALTNCLQNEQFCSKCCNKHLCISNLNAEQVLETFLNLQSQL